VAADETVTVRDCAGTVPQGVVHHRPDDGLT
jgi:hypothetical protein